MQTDDHPLPLSFGDSIELHPVTHSYRVGCAYALDAKGTLDFAGLYKALLVPDIIPAAGGFDYRSFQVRVFYKNKVFFMKNETHHPVNNYTVLWFCS